MCRAFQPFTMQGIYFSLCASTQIKYIPFIFVSYRAIAYKVSKNTASLKNHFEVKGQRSKVKGDNGITVSG